MSNPDLKTTRESPFWRFSVSFYSLPDVAAACLDLQDAAGADVNIIMFLLWNATAQRKFSAADLRDLDARIGPWRDKVVVPLRTLRRALKSPPAVIEPSVAEKFRTRIKGIELEAERLQQEALYELAPSLKLSPAVSPAEAARASLAAYQGLCAKPFPNEAVEIVLAAFHRQHGRMNHGSGVL
jgi:uncharacterized protein (TIGR02444 family)